MMSSQAAANAGQVSGSCSRLRYVKEGHGEAFACLGTGGPMLRPSLASLVREMCEEPTRFLKCMNCSSRRSLAARQAHDMS